MANAKYRVPFPPNEPVKNYAPGSPEREELKATLAKLKGQQIEIPLIIGGKEVRTGKIGHCVIPHDHQQAIATYHQAGKKEVQMATIIEKAQTLISANLHGILDKALQANSLAVLDEYIRQAQDNLDDLEDAAATVGGQVKTLKRKTEEFPHFDIFNKRNWGLIIYDEVHLLPAPVFRITAEIQACRRLGLTATLVREDHKEDDVFSLIGPKRFDVPWKELEKQGWIATAECIEIRVPLPDSLRMHYATADGRAQFRIASENPLKIEVARSLINDTRPCTVAH